MPLLRAADNTLHPVIGAPWCLGSPESGQLYRPDRRMDINPIMTLTAFAGPLTSSKVLYTAFNRTSNCIMSSDRSDHNYHNHNIIFY